MFIRLISFFCLLAAAASAQAYVTVRNLELEAGSADALRIHTGQGDMSVRGAQVSAVQAELVIEFDADWTEDEAEELLERVLVFELSESGGGLRLDARLDFDDESTGFGGFLRDLVFHDGRDAPRLHLEVTVPAALALEVHDGSGAVNIRDLEAALTVHDGSGDIAISRIGAGTLVHDGSGDLRAEDIGGFLEVHDGSGTISLERLRAGAEIHDGSGDILVTDAGGDLRIMDGSGGIVVRQVVGNLTVRDGSGDIDVDGVRGDARISDGSGSVRTRGVEGNLRSR